MGEEETRGSADEPDGPNDTEWRTVELDAELKEALLIDPIRGPVTFQVDGSASFMLNVSATPQWSDPMGDHQKRGGQDFSKKLWYMMGVTEQQVLLQQAAKKNSRLRSWKAALVADIEKDLEYVGTWLYGKEDWQRYVVSKVAGAKLRVDGRLQSGAKTSGLLRPRGGEAGGFEAALELPRASGAGRFAGAGTLRLRFAAPGRLVCDFQEQGAENWTTDVPLWRERRRVEIKMAESVAAKPSASAVGG
mmetsp:Transcript_60881/g.122030  ORF Transcript_60881/g.122030 Transcript_60881/m.122030 type:complete len:248 (-) Transcript_60881:112-855(-)